MKHKGIVIALFLLGVIAVIIFMERFESRENSFEDAIHSEYVKCYERHGIAPNAIESDTIPDKIFKECSDEVDKSTGAEVVMSKISESTAADLITNNVMVYVTTILGSTIECVTTYPPEQKGSAYTFPIHENSTKRCNGDSRINPLTTISVDKETGSLTYSVWDKESNDYIQKPIPQEIQTHDPFPKDILGGWKNKQNGVADEIVFDTYEDGYTYTEYNDKWFFMSCPFTYVKDTIMVRCNRGSGVDYTFKIMNVTPTELKLYDVSNEEGVYGVYTKIK